MQNLNAVPATPGLPDSHSEIPPTPNVAEPPRPNRAPSGAGTSGPYRIAFGNGKGGVGKTNLAFHSALGLAHQGRRVGYIDTDMQQTLTRALTLRELAGDEPLISAFDPSRRDEYDYILIDSPPRIDEREFLREVKKADLVCLVAQPALEDIWGLVGSLPALLEQRPDAPFVIVANRYIPGRILAKSFPEMLRNHQIDIPLLQSGGRPFYFHDRECYKHSKGAGWAALDESGQLGVTLLAGAIAETVRTLKHGKA